MSMSTFSSFTFHFAHRQNSNDSFSSGGIRVLYWSLRTIDAVGFCGTEERRPSLSGVVSSESASANLFCLFDFFSRYSAFHPQSKNMHLKCIFFPPVNAIHPDIFMQDICAVISVVNIETIDSERAAVTFFPL